MFNSFHVLTLDGLLLFSALGRTAPAAPDTLRTGYQKNSVNMMLAKNHQLLGQRYPDTHISRIKFPAGPQMLEALNIDSIGIGSTGDIPLIFTQAAGADLVYIGSEPPKPKAGVVLVAQGSPIHNAAELKGKKAAFQKDSSSHSLLLRALQLAGLKFSGIQPVYLAPADARAALQQGNVDAWAIQDPYYSAALLRDGARVLTNDTNLKQAGSFYFASRPYVGHNGTFVEGILDTSTQAGTLAHSQRAQDIALLVEAMGLPETVIVSYLDHRPPTSVAPVSAETAARQQQTADLFYESKLVPEKADIRARIQQSAIAQGTKS